MPRLKPTLIPLAFAAALAHGEACITATPFSTDYDSVDLLQDNGLVIVERNGKYGLINHEELIIAAPQYDKIWQHQGNRALFLQGERYGYLDEKGQIAIPAQYEEARFFADDRAAVKKGEHWGYIDRDGRDAIPAQYHAAGDFSEGLAAVRQNGEWQWIDTQGKTAATLDGRYSHIQPLENGITIASQGGGNHTIKSLSDAAGLATHNTSREYLVNRDGKRLTDGDYILQISDCAPDAPVRFKKNPDDLWGLYDHEGREILPPTYEHISHFCDGLADASRDKHQAYIDHQGREVLTPDYEYTDPFAEGLAAVEKNNLTGYIDRDGREVIPLQFARGEYFKGGLASFKNEKGDWGLIDRKGRIVLEPAYQIIHRPFAQQRSFAAKDGRWYLLDAGACTDIP